MAKLSSVLGALKLLPGNSDLLDTGVSSAGIAWVKLASDNGTAQYLFVSDSGVLKVHTAEPTADSDGSPLPIGTIDTAEITNYAVTGAKLAPKKGYFQVAVSTNGTTPVNVFGAGGAPCALTVTSVVSIAKDTTAGNIILKQAANTVSTIAKGVTAGALVGATSLANATYAAADVCTVESSSAGNSFVLITFEVA